MQQNENNKMTKKGKQGAFRKLGIFSIRQKTLLSTHQKFLRFEYVLEVKE